jgi:hypothetical protein
VIAREPGKSLFSVSYAPRHDATPEAERSALAAAFRFLMNCSNEKEATRPGRPDDTEKPENARTAKTNYSD